MWEVIFAKYAAPGMCNPADDQPCTAGTPSQAQIDNDHRTLAQRQHDALLAIGRIALMSGDIGQLNGLPVVGDHPHHPARSGKPRRYRCHRRGHQTAHRRRDPDGRARQSPSRGVRQRDRPRAGAVPGQAGRSPAQRIMLIARDGGCTKPCCTVGAYGCQAHHAPKTGAKGGHTNVDEMALACGTDNRSADDDGGWQTTINTRGEIEWTPPPDLDHGQSRVNYYHRPEALLRPAEDRAAIRATPPEPTQLKAKRHNDTHAEPGHLDPTETPGGPEPPDNQAA